MPFFEKSQKRKKTKRKMKESSRTIKVTTMKRMTEAIRCRWAVGVSGEG